MSGLKDFVARFVVSTRHSADEGWETAIAGAGTYEGDAAPVVVARYDSEHDACTGHVAWRERLERAGPTPFPVVALGSEVLGVEDELEILQPMGLREAMVAKEATK